MDTFFINNSSEKKQYNHALNKGIVCRLCCILVQYQKLI